MTSLLHALRDLLQQIRNLILHERLASSGPLLHVVCLLLSLVEILLQVLLPLFALLLLFLHQLLVFCILRSNDTLTLRELARMEERIWLA